MKWRDWPIQRKQLVAIFATSMFVLILAVGSMFLIERRNYSKQAVRNLRSVAELLAENSAAVLLFNDPGSAHEILAGLHIEEQVKEAAIYDARGKLFARYPTNAPASQFAAQPGPLGTTFTDGDLLLVQPIQQGQVLAGLLYLRADLADLRTRLRQYAILLGLVLLGSGIVALAISNLLQKQITQPVLKLAETAAKVSSQRNYALRVEKTSQDELGVLADAFNQMLGQVQQQEGQLRAELEQRTKVETALRRSHEQLQFISDNVPALISYVDLEGKYRFCNLAYTLWFGLHPSKIIGRHMSEILGEQAWQTIRGHVERALSGQPANFETEAHYARGGKRWIQAIYTPDRDRSSKVVGLVVMVNDITERKKSELERAWLAAVVESSQDAILTKTLDGIIRSWNQGAERLFGFPAIKAIGSPITLIVPPERHEEEANILQRVRRGEAVEHYETTRITIDGRLLDVSLSVSPVQNAEGQIVAASAIVRDISQQKRAERELRDAQAKLARHAEELEQTVTERTAKLRETVGDLEAFSYSISHDMRAPLRSIRGYADVMLNDAGISEEHRNFLQRIARNAERMDRLIQDVLAYSRLSKAQLDLEPVDLDRLVTDILQQYPQFQPPLAKIDVQRPLGTVLGHEAALTQVISNLLGNAVKFVEPGALPEVRVWSEEAETSGSVMLRIFFEDRGIGIPTKDLERIFSIFERVNPERAYEGTGIGLSIVRKAVERMGGFVSLKSEPGRGSRFCVQLRKA